MLILLVFLYFFHYLTHNEHTTIDYVLDIFYFLTHNEHTTIDYVLDIFYFCVRD